LRAGGISLKSPNQRPRPGTRLVRDAYAQGYRKFIAVGGDGTSYEIVNGIFPADKDDRATLAFLPLGTGNSFLRDFSDRGVDFAIEALLAQRSGLRRSPAHPRSRFASLHQLAQHGFFPPTWPRCAPAVSAGGARWVTRRPSSSPWLAFGGGPSLAGGCRAGAGSASLPVPHFSNSKFTGGTMMIAPKAEVDDGLIEYVRWGPIGRLGLIRNLPTLYDGTHIEHPLAERRQAKRIDFQLDDPVDVMVDGEVLTCAAAASTSCLPP